MFRVEKPRDFPEPQPLPAITEHFPDIFGNGFVDDKFVLVVGAGPVTVGHITAEIISQFRVRLFDCLDLFSGVFALELVK